MGDVRIDLFLFFLYNISQKSIMEGEMKGLMGRTERIEYLIERARQGDRDAFRQVAEE